MSDIDTDLEDVALWAAEVGGTGQWDATGYAARDAGEMPVIEAGKAPADRTPAVLSTDRQARDGDIIRQNWRLAEFKANPVILDNHDMRCVVGSGEDVRVEDGPKGKRLVGTTVWDLDDARGCELARKYERRIMRAFSVRWIPSKLTDRSTLKPDDPYYKAREKIETPWGLVEIPSYVHEAPTLLEWSPVSIPCAPEALAQRAQRSLGIRPAGAAAVASSIATRGALLTAPAGASLDWLAALRALVEGDASARDELHALLAIGLRATGDTPGASNLRAVLDGLANSRRLEPVPSVKPFATQVAEHLAAIQRST